MPYCSTVSLRNEQHAITQNKIFAGNLGVAALGMSAFAAGTAAVAGPFAAAPAGLALGLGFAAAKLAADNEVRSAAFEQRESVCSDLAASGLLNNAGNYVGPGARFINTGGGSGCWIEKVGGSVTVDKNGNPVITASTTRVTCKPIVLDLDGDGFEWISLANPISGDPRGTGATVVSSWIGSDDGVLVFDHDGDGQAVKSEWVLTGFIPGARTDLEALQGFDTNADGVFNGSDANWSRFKVGRDFNQNGKFDQGELFELGSYGISSIRTETGITAVGSTSQPYRPVDGIQVYNFGQFVRHDGSVGSFADMAFETFDFPTSFENYGTYLIYRQGTVATYLTHNDLTASVSLSTSLQNFIGAGGSDYAYGDAGNNFIAGAGGADFLYGGAGDDIVLADAADISWGIVRGDAGNDALIVNDSSAVTVDAYASGFEMVTGGSGNDRLYSSANEFVMVGATLSGGDGNDILTGGWGDDYLIGGAGADSFAGGSGDDTFVIDRYDYISSISGGNSAAYPGEGYGDGDKIIIDDSVGMVLSNLYSLGVEQAYGGGGNDTIYASRSDGYYYQQRTGNTLHGGAGDDYLYGGAGEDVYVWSSGDGNDTFVDKDYGEQYGDVIDLGFGINASEVRVEDSAAGRKIYIDGAGGGTITVRGFAQQYGPHDWLAVNGATYDLNVLFATAATHYGYGGLVLSTQVPNSGGYPTGGGGTGGGDTGGTGGGGGGGGGTGGGGGPGTYTDVPVIFDLGNDGFQLIDPKRSGVFFDWTGDGRKEQTGWVGPDDALLVIDRNGDGQITSREEIAFGQSSGKHEPFVTDLEGLRAYDSNGNGSLDAEDSLFGSFGIWRDADSDAIADEGELLSLAEFGVLAMSLSGYETGDKIGYKENGIFATTDAVLVTGDTLKVADAFISYDGKDAHSSYSGLSDRAFNLAYLPANDLSLVYQSHI